MSSGTINITPSRTGEEKDPPLTLSLTPPPSDVVVFETGTSVRDKVEKRKNGLFRTIRVGSLADVRITKYRHTIPGSRIDLIPFSGPCENRVNKGYYLFVNRIILMKGYCLLFTSSDLDK